MSSSITQATLGGGILSPAGASNFARVNSSTVLSRLDLVGGKGTYEEILGIYREVGKQKGQDLLDQLALDY
jgi:hypothetical protein